MVSPEICQAGHARRPGPSTVAGTTGSSATPDATATPTPTPTPAAAPELPDNVEGFNRVSQRTDDGVRVGLYRSADRGAVVEIRIAQDTNARDMIADLGGVNPTTSGDATCSTQGDTICAQEDGDTTVAIATKQLPASTVAELTTAVIAAD